MWAEFCDVFAPMNEECSTWEKEIKKIEWCKQRQDSTRDQLKDLVGIAEKLGFCDAADYIRKRIEIK